MLSTEMRKLQMSNSFGIVSQRFIGAFQRRRHPEAEAEIQEGNEGSGMSAPQGEYRTPIRSWHVYATLFAIFMTCITLLWQWAASRENIEGRLSRAETDIQQMQRDYARKDVVEQQLNNIEAMTRSVEATSKETSAQLQQILIRLGK